MLKPLLYILPFLTSTYTFSESTQINLANEDQKNVNFDVNGTLRFKYTHNDHLIDSGNKIEFFDAVLWLNYKHNLWSAYLDYRAYEAHNKLAGIHYLANAWVGYQFAPKHHLKLGLQPIPIGVDCYYSSTFNLSMLYALGLEEVNHFGVTYQFTPEHYQLELGYFARNAGSQTGKSENSSHYSSNLTAESSFNQGTQLEEKNIFAAKLSRKLNIHPKIESYIGASYFYGDVENLQTNQNGDRKIWTIFHKSQWQNLGSKIVFGGQKINNQDQTFEDFSTFGLADGYYNVANHANFLSAEINYLLNVDLGQNFSHPLLYSNYSRYIKNKQNYQDSERWINGVYFTYKDNFRFYFEHVSAKNDTAFGGGAHAYAEGKNSDWNQLTYLSLGYYF